MMARLPDWKFQAAIDLAKERDDDELGRIVLGLGAELIRRDMRTPSEGAMRQHVASEEVHEQWRYIIEAGTPSPEDLRASLVEAQDRWQVPPEDRQWHVGPWSVS